MARRRRIGGPAASAATAATAARAPPPRHVDGRVLVLLAIALLGSSGVDAFLHVGPRGSARYWCCPSRPQAAPRPTTTALAAGGAASLMEAVKAAPTPNYGETQGAELYLKGVSVAAGANRLINDVEWKINKGERVGIVGGNGAGKSTLLSVIAGAFLPEEGSVTVHPRATLGYLVQTAVSGSTRPLVEEAMSQMTRYHAAKAAVAEAEARVEADPSDAHLLGLERAQALLEEAGGSDVERRVDNILSGLGFQRSDYARPCTDFSGGWQMRIALARLLLGEPSLLLLDEPTNHLDSAAKAWLMHFLASYHGTVLLVSHEEELLRDLRCTTVAEVINRGLELYRCDYDKFLLQREERAEALAAAAARQAKERERIQGFIDRFGAKATLASSANSRKKMLDKMEVIEAPAAQAKRPKLRLPPPPKVMPELVKLANATFGYPPAPPMVEGLDLTLTRGSRLVLLGPNGCGKSTVLKALTGSLPLLSGQRALGDGLEMGVFTQDLAQDLPQDQVALDYVLATVRQRDMSISDQQARAAMGALGLAGEKATRPIAALSGGEKARVALSVFVLVPHNLLVLDEPSNHLDIATMEVLTGALAEYPGTLVVVSHNKAFVERLRPTHIGLIRSRRLVVEERSLRPTDWAMDVDNGSGSSTSSSSSGNKAGAPAAAEAGEAKPALSYAEQRARFKKISAAPKRIAKLEEMIGEKERKAEEYDRDLYKAGADVSKAMELTERKESLLREVEALYAEWEELEALLAEAEAEKGQQ